MLAPRSPAFCRASPSPGRYGGSHLGSARFRAIVGAAADVLQAIDDLDLDADDARAGSTKSDGTKPDGRAGNGRERDKGKGKGKGKKR